MPDLLASSVPVIGQLIDPVNLSWPSRSSMVIAAKMVANFLAWLGK